MVNSLPKLTTTVLFLLLITLICGQIAPQFQVINKTLGATTSYKLSYYSSNAFNTSTTITVAFTQSYVKVPQGAINCTIKVNSVLAPLPTCTCTNKTCTFKPMTSFNFGAMQIQMFNLINPLFIYAQIIPVNVYFSSSANYSFPTSNIPGSTYLPMPVTINKINQSDYGVGFTPVTYAFNLSLPYVSKNMQMQLTIPNQVTYSSVPSTLTFYNAIQNLPPYQISNMMIFTLQINQIINPTGFMLLTMSNLGNPTFLGNSSSFKVTFFQTSAVTGCQTCKIAEITSGMLIQSRNPGDIETVSIIANNNYNSQPTNLTITLKFYAGIPLGGKISIYLPPQITPVLPIACAQIYGFIITNNSFNTTDPVCTYNDTNRRIDTVNFNTPIFSSTGDGIIAIQVVNPPDSRQVNLKFETYDNYTRMIGQSRSNSYYSSIPVPLKAIVSKTSQEIDKSFNMICNLTLTQSLNLSSSFIQVILPSVNYNLSAIICTSAGQDLNCSKTLNIQQQLVLTFPPPCSQCNANNSLQFTVMNLKNPPFISDANQMLIVNTRSSLGIIQSSTKIISLIPTSINLFSYNKPISKPVGFQYNLTLNLSIPDYVKTNGGQIHILFSPKSTYYDGQLSGFNYNGPSTLLEIVSSNSTSIISNSVQYDPDSTPDTISKIIFNICDGTVSVCSLTDSNFTFIIRRLKLGYIPFQQTTDTLRISTQFGEIIAQKLLDTSSYAPVLYTAPLNIYVSRSVTNSLSDFQFTFLSNEVVFDQILTFTLPTSLIINGLCTLSSSQGFISSFSCTKTSNNSISISSSCDQNLMISQNISYTISISNVTTPISMVPLTYTLQTTYNGTKNQRFSVRYAMQSACPLSVTYSKTNYTINQEFKLSITINPVTLLYDSYQINLAKNTVITQIDWVSPYGFVQNQTHYILSRTGVMTNNYTEIRLKNSLSTYQPPQYTVNLLQAGYLAQQYIISPPNNLPVMLGCNVSLTNRTVNFLANMTITCDRNSNGQLNDKSLIIKLPVNSFDYSGALFNGVAISTVNPVINISINTTSPRIISATITSLKNLLYIPNLQNPSYSTNSIPNIDISTIQNNSTMIVGTTSISAQNYIPNDAYDIKNVSAARTSTKSGQFTNITLQYVTYLGTAQHAMVITLPSGQNGFNSSSGCYTGTNLDSCNIIQYNSTDMRIMLVPNTTVVLTKSINYYPNTNLLKIRIFKFPEMQLVEQSYTQISPAIALEKITVFGRGTSSRVGDISTLSLQLRPATLKIQSSNTIQISVPPKMYTRTFNTDDCIIKPSISINTYTGCTYDYDTTNGWLTMIRVGSFGPVDIDTNSSLFINFTVTNAWTTYSFVNQSFSVTVYKTESTASSQGNANLIDIYPNLTAFTPLPISQPQTKFTQLLLTSGSSNNLTINFTANGNIGKGTKLMCMVPKDAFIYTAATGITFERQDVSYFYISLPTNCTNAGCLAYSQQFVIPVQNNYYIKKQKNNIIFYLQYDGLPNSQSYAIAPDYHIPLSLPALTLNRSSSTGGQLTTVSIKFNLTLTSSSSVSWFGPITIDICRNITSSKYLSTVFAFNQQQDTQFTQIQSVTYNQNEQNITVGVPVNVSNSSVISQVKISGKNTIQAPIGQETYWIVVQNTTHILYTSYNIMFASKLVPMSQGLTISRSDTTVGVITDLRVQGSLPSDQLINITQYPLSVNSVPYGNLNQTTIDIPLNPYTNPQIIGQQPLTNISICNISHCIYRQPNTSITPALTPISFTSSDVQVKIPATMNISTNYSLIINFTRQITGKNFVKVITDGALYSTLLGCNGYFYNQSSQRTQKIANLSASVSALSTSSGGTSKLITVSSQLVAKTINIISLQIIFKSPEYQLSLQNTEVTLQFQPPSTIYKNKYNVSIIGTLLNSNLTCTSNKTNQIANYTLLIEPILRSGLLTIQIPSYISGLFVGASLSSPTDDTMSDHLMITVNGNGVSVTGTNSQPIAANQVPGLYLLSYNSSTSLFYINLMIDPSSNSPNKSISVKLTNVQNPPDNRIIVFRLFQHQIQVTPTSVYGYRELSNKMSVLDPIHVYSGIRNMTKIGARIQLALDIQTLIVSPDSMIIRLSQTQVLVNETDANPCTICIDNTSCGAENIAIQVVSGSNAVKISPHRPGRHNYTISGCLINSMFSQQPTQGDQIYVSLSTPYQTAQTTNITSTYITPLISTGQIQILNLSSSSNKRADYTTLSLSIKPENWMNCDGINLKFDELAYYVHKNIECFINGLSVPFYVINSSSLFIQVSVKNSTLNIQVKNIINYIVNSGFVLSALKKKVSNSTNTTQVLRSLGAQMSFYNSSDYGISDQISVPPINSGFVSYVASTRIIFPDNYASTQPKKIMAINDYNIPQQLPTNTLKYSFASSYPGCSSQLQYNKTISMYCTMSSPGTATFNVLLYDTKLAATSLTSFSKSIYIYPQPKDHCSNVMCDVCSTGTDGNQYCFACREGLYSSNGQCVSQCPGQTFPYDSKTCTQCSPECASCFDLYDNSCLSCQDSSLLLDSGTCRKYCTEGYAYQAQYCVDNQQCSSASGCRICSPSGFCYKCLPDFMGQPNCKFSQILPKNFFIFWMIPFILLIPIVGIITCIKVGTATLSHMIIFLLAVAELMSWIFIIPKMPQQSLAMIMCAFLLVKIIVSIIAYETYYNKQILKGKQQKLLNANDRESEQKTDHLQANSKKSKQGVKQQSIQQKITHKERLARFSAHFLACDAYELLMNRLGKPFMNIAHFTPFLIVSIINRAIVMIFCVFIIVKYASGDLLYVPLISILSGSGIIIIRLINSEKFSACIAKIRG